VGTVSANTQVGIGGKGSTAEKTLTEVVGLTQGRLPRGSDILVDDSTVRDWPEEESNMRIVGTFSTDQKHDRA
jgi:hypothetical protein